MTTALRHIRAFAHEHDDMPAFTAVYVVATILAAALLSLGWCVLLVVLHMTLDTVKYREVHGFSFLRTCKAVFLESAVDIALALTALTFAVYLHHTFLLSSVGGLMRSQLTIIRALGTVIPQASIVQHILLVGMNLHEYMHSPHPHMDQSLTRVERWSMLTIAVMIVLIAVAGVLLAEEGGSVSLIIAEQMSLAL
jgi:hypothetical protein